MVHLKYIIAVIVVAAAATAAVVMMMIQLTIIVIVMMMMMMMMMTMMTTTRNKIFLMHTAQFDTSCILVVLCIVTWYVQLHRCMEIHEHSYSYT